MSGSSPNVVRLVPFMPSNSYQSKAIIHEGHLYKYRYMYSETEFKKWDFQHVNEFNHILFECGKQVIDRKLEDVFLLDHFVNYSYL